MQPNVRWAGRETAALAEAEFAVPPVPVPADVTVPPAHADIAVPPADADVTMPTAAQKSSAEPAETQSVAGTAAATPVVDVAAESTAKVESGTVSAAPVIALGPSATITSASVPAETNAAAVPAQPEISAVLTEEESAIVKLRARLPMPMTVLLRRLPIIAGQDVEQYIELLCLVVDEWNPQSYQQCRLVKQMTDAEWDILTYRDVRVWQFDAAIAQDLFAQLIDRAVEYDGKDNHQKGSYAYIQQDPPFELTYVQHWWRKTRRIVFAAAAGDKASIEFVEKQLGVGKVAMSPHTAKQLESCIPSQILLDRVINAAIARHNDAYRQLAQIASERSKKGTELVE